MTLIKRQQLVGYAVVRLFDRVSPMYTIRPLGFFVPLCERYIARLFGYNQACHVALEVMRLPTSHLVFSGHGGV